MTERDIGVVLKVHVDLLSSSAVVARNRSETDTDLCASCRSWTGTRSSSAYANSSYSMTFFRVALAMDVSHSQVVVSDAVRSLVAVGSRVSLVEGNRPIGSADVRDIE